MHAQRRRTRSSPVCRSSRPDVPHRRSGHPLRPNSARRRPTGEEGRSVSPSPAATAARAVGQLQFEVVAHRSNTNTLQGGIKRHDTSRALLPRMLRVAPSERNCSDSSTATRSRGTDAVNARPSARIRRLAAAMQITGRRQIPRAARHPADIQKQLEFSGQPGTKCAPLFPLNVIVDRRESRVLECRSYSFSARPVTSPCAASRGTLAAIASGRAFCDHHVHHRIVLGLDCSWRLATDLARPAGERRVLLGVACGPARVRAAVDKCADLCIPRAAVIVAPCGPGRG